MPSVETPIIIVVVCTIVLLLSICGSMIFRYMKGKPKRISGEIASEKKDASDSVQNAEGSDRWETLKINERNKIAEREIAVYAEWMTEHDLQHAQSYGDLIVEPYQNKWLKRGVEIIFSADEIVDVTIKNSRQMYSRILVLIETNKPNCLLVTIDCGCSEDLANKIKSELISMMERSRNSNSKVRNDEPHFFDRQP